MSLRLTLLILLAVPARAAAEPFLKLSTFADARVGWQSAERGSPVPAHRGFERTAAGAAENGFSLAMVGVDVVAGTPEARAVLGLRFGPGITAWHGNNGAAGLDNLMQGFVRWQPVDEFTLDFGQFTTIFGAEVADSFRNRNYTRGALFWLMQPFWHTGLRVSWQASPSITLTGLAVNGINTLTDDDDQPSVGLQAAWAMGGGFTLMAWGLQAPDPDAEPSGIDTFFDVVATWQGAKTLATLNFDLGLNTGADAAESDGRFLGAALILHRTLTDAYGVAGRFELLSDPRGRFYGQDTTLRTFTLTLEAKPAAHLVLRWDNRFERASTEVFRDGGGSPANVAFLSVVGAAVFFEP